jgi:tetratricopeptide (TPR) repeat protein
MFAMARSYHELGQEEQALKIFTHLRADPAIGPNAALFAGTIHLHTRQYDQAVADFEIGLRHENINPDLEVELKYRMAATYIKQQDIGNALLFLNAIALVSPEYKDVAQLLNRYRELNTNENLKVYLIAQTSDFVTLCRKIAVRFFADSKVKVTDVSIQKAEYADILTDITTPKWEESILFRFVRTTGTVGELILRDLYSRIKEVKAGRGLCIAAGSFSEGAKQFVEARLIDLVDKDRLMEHLRMIGR